MRIRYIPFGYRIMDGTIVPHDAEAEVVRLVFRKYINGESYNSIAASLETAGCPYNGGSSGWNKNMVGRILQNRRYLGQDGYPILITEHEFQHASHLQQKKHTRQNIQTAPEISALKGKVICGECGCAYRRLLDRRGAKWACNNIECHPAVKVTDALLTEEVTSLMNLCIQDPERIEISPIEIQRHDLTVARLTNEINRELDKIDCNEEHVKALIMERAAAQYEISPDGSLPQKAREIRAAFENREPTEQFDPELFEYAVEAVIVQPDGTVSLKLKTGQILENRPERRTTL